MCIQAKTGNSIGWTTSSRTSNQHGIQEEVLECSQMYGKGHTFQEVFQPEHVYHDLQNFQVIDADGGHN